jgi:talin
MLINSVKDVALALNNLINVTKSASGKNIDDPEMQKLKESAKIMVTNVTQLLRTVKTVEDESQRGTNALEIAIESIGQELQAYNNGQIPTNRTTPEELIRATKQVNHIERNIRLIVERFFSCRLQLQHQKQSQLVNHATKKISS